MLRKNGHTPMDDKKKDHPDRNRPPKRNFTKQLQTHNVLRDDVENCNGTNQGGDSLFVNKPWTVPWRIERIAQGIKRDRRSTIHWSTYPQGEPEKKLSWGDNPERCAITITTCNSGDASESHT